MKALLAILQLLSGMFFFSAGVLQAINHSWIALVNFFAATVWIAAFVFTLQSKNQHE